MFFRPDNFYSDVFDIFDIKRRSLVIILFKLSERTLSCESAIVAYSINFSNQKRLYDSI